jgi:hypothetical protein
MPTKTQIATKVLQKLTVLEADETADSNDLSLVEGKYDAIYPLLAARDSVSWGSTDDIPVEAEIPVVGLVARECIEEFTVPQIVAQSLIINEDRYHNQLRMIEYQYYRPETTQEYY